MSSTSVRLVVAGSAFLVVGILLLAIGAWMSFDPLATLMRHLLAGSAFVVSGLSCLITAHRWMRPDSTGEVVRPRDDDGSMGY